MQMLQQSADTANARLQADPRLKQVLAEAVGSNNQAEAQQILTKAGFSAEQVSNAKLVMVNHALPGGGETKSRIIITIKFIPPTIIIRF
jgi:crotonobetainyl-CoA:carnitine CoA-transferase CaiB-like acyl-CoA transferase